MGASGLGTTMITERKSERGRSSENDAADEQFDGFADQASAQANAVPVEIEMGNLGGVVL